MTVLRVDRLTVAREGRDIVQEVSLSLSAGKFLAVLGPNGAGKSTLLRAVAGLLPFRLGTVEWFGRSLPDWDRKNLARQVAWLSQSGEEGWGFRGLEYVLLGRSPHLSTWALHSPADVELARQALAEADVLSLAERGLAECSGGERRLLGLARAFVQGGDVLLLDEPTAFLDLRHQIHVLERIRARVRAGASAVVILHDVNLAAAFADEVLLLKEGHTVAQGAVREALTAPALEALFEVRMGEAQLDGQRLLGPRISR